MHVWNSGGMHGDLQWLLLILINVETWKLLESQATIKFHSRVDNLLLAGRYACTLQ